MDDTTFRSLPLYESAQAIQEELEKGSDLLLTAPTGSGKSTFIPWLLAGQNGGNTKVAVLEPRRLATTSLAGYLSRLVHEETGGQVGYRIRFESKISERTRILFSTYGSFLQSLLHSPENFDWIVFDEFHERRAEMDLLLAYFLALKKRLGKAHSPRIAILSAELNREELEKFLGEHCLKVGRPGFSVQVLNQEVPAGSPLAKSVEKALRTLERNKIWKTTLVFLPGKGEISSVHRHLDDAFGYGKLNILDLYGGQSADVEREIFRETESPRIILSTNIAETSLTVPGVTGVVDSGLERTTEFNAEQKKNLLKLSRISLQNAVQRTGRAGRTQAGVCIRLWSAREECLFPKGIVPEILRADLRPILLECAALVKKANVPTGEFLLPTSPDDNLAEKAKNELADIGFLDADGVITPLGERALDIPLNDLSLAKAYLESRELSDLSLATFAVLDSEESSGKDRGPQSATNLAEDLLHKGNRTSRETRLTFKRLSDFAHKKDSGKFRKGDPFATAKLFFNAFPNALAIQSGNAYRTKNDTFPIPPALVQDAKAILVFGLLRTNSAQKSEMRAGLYIEIPESFLQSENESVRYELLWRSGQERYIGVEIRSSGETEISRTEILPQEAGTKVLQSLKALTAVAWMERHKREDLSHLWMDEANKILLCKMKLAVANFPEFGLPEWNVDDMNLVTEDFFDGVFLMRDLSPERFRKKMQEYFGESMILWLEKTFPDSLALPNGKRARYRYTEDSPVELSARIEDFLPFRGEHTIAGGKIKVRYDILAPNYRTAQKTWNLTGFWHNTYPQIRKELRGRYPKHLWPESID